MSRKLKTLKTIECEFSGLIPSQIVSHYLFNDDEEKASNYLQALVNNGVLIYLNSNESNHYYRFKIDYPLDCNFCREDGCIEPVNG